MPRLDAAIGATLAGKYSIRRLLGAGGMGAVYEGEHVEIGKRVAIKVIEPGRARSPEIAARFKREARAASKVESDHIVQVFDVGQDDAFGLYMVMEFLSGEDLSARLRRERRLEVPVAVAIALQASRALAKAHAAGVIHRDLKPANLFLTAREDGSIHAKILDFGISKLTSDEGGGQSITGQHGGALTRQGVVIGTPQYMSPEQAQGLPLDHRTDIWSLGAVTYEALAGQSAYKELSTYEQTIIQIVMSLPRPLAEIAPWVPPELAAIVHDALTHDVTRRIQDCATFARRLADAVPAAWHGPTSRLHSVRGEEVRSHPDAAKTPQVVIRAPSTGDKAPLADEDVLSSTLAGEGALPAPSVPGADDVPVSSPQPGPPITSNPATAAPMPLVPRAHTTSGVAVVPEEGPFAAILPRRRQRLLFVVGSAMAGVALVIVAGHALRSPGAEAPGAAVAPAASGATVVATVDPPAVAAAPPVATLPPPSAAPAPPPTGPADVPAASSSAATQAARPKPAKGAKASPSSVPAPPASKTPPAQPQFGGTGISNTL